MLSYRKFNPPKNHKIYVKTVIKRNGKEVPIEFDKITRRIKSLSTGLCVEPSFLTTRIVSRLSNCMHVSKIDELAAEESAFMLKDHIDYLTLAGRLMVSNLHKETPSCFSEAMEIVNHQSWSTNQENKTSFFLDEFMAAVRKHAKVLDAAIQHNADYLYDYFGICTLMNGYLNKTDGKIVERPQYMWMRVALFLNMDNIPMALKTYEMFSKKYYTHASPTLFNAGKKEPQCSSCYLLQIPQDSLESIYDTLKQTAQISKNAGGIGLSVHKIRAAGSMIKSSGGLGDGLVPMLRVYNATARYVNQGGKRKGAFAIYIEPWHADIFSFLDLKKNRGSEDLRARDLHYGLWVPDLFMNRVEKDEMWSLFSEDTAPGLSSVYGEEFEKLYCLYETQGKSVKTLPARKLFETILDMQMETGEPYILYKDACNKKSNQQNLGTITSSNLCVTPETPILTQTGYHPISHLKDKFVNVWNGKDWSRVKVCQTSNLSPITRVYFSDGSHLECTSYHQFYVQDNPTPIPTHKLSIGQEIIHFNLPSPQDFIMNPLHNLTNPYYEGFTSGGKTKYSTIYVPINGTLDNKIKWLEGYVEGYETETSNKTLTFKNCPSYLLEQLRLLFHTCGIYPTIVGTDLIITSSDIDSLKMMGFKTENKSLAINTPKPNTITVTVTKIESNIKSTPTFCFNEPELHRGVFNGILTGNCTEIIEYTSQDEIAVCNLASICLPSFVENNQFDHKKLFDVVNVITQNLNRVIDLNYYPIQEAKNSNMRNRPMGIGVQGLADVFSLLKCPFESDQARVLNRDIFETIYYAALTASIDLASKSGPYETYAGSPTSKGILQFDMWGVSPSSRWDWNTLRTNLNKFGVRNSLLIAPMPTASTSQIMGFNEAFEPYTSNLYTRRTLSGDFIVVNQHLARLLSEKGLWGDEFFDTLVAHEGSVQNIEGLSDDIKALFKTAYEIKSKPIIDMAADRGAFIDQSQSMNVWMKHPTRKSLYNMHMYAFKKGLKTGMYYLRSQALASAQKITIDPKLVEQSNLSRESNSNSNTKNLSGGGGDGGGDGSGGDNKEKKSHESSNDGGGMNVNKIKTEDTCKRKLHESSDGGDGGDGDGDGDGDDDDGDNITTVTTIKKPKIYTKNGKTYECNDDICTSCGS
jgi:ribonucleoside-diphosphate reductase alpha chain